jgi:hypothetical protein
MCDGLGKLRGHRPQEIGVGCSLPARQSTLVRATNFGWFFVVRPALSMNRDGSKSRAKATAAARFARRLPTNFFGEECRQTRWLSCVRGLAPSAPELAQL